jgi:polar amino acid transport system ATP-binding protein
VGEVLARVRELKLEGMTMLIATHAMSFARDVADEICFSTTAGSSSTATPRRCSRIPSSRRPSAFCAGC